MAAELLFHKRSHSLQTTENFEQCLHVQYRKTPFPQKGHAPTYGLLDGEGGNDILRSFLNYNLYLC